MRQRSAAERSLEVTNSTYGRINTDSCTSRATPRMVLAVRVRALARVCCAVLGEEGRDGQLGLELIGGQRSVAAPFGKHTVHAAEVGRFHLEVLSKPKRVHLYCAHTTHRLARSSVCARARA